MQSLPKIGRIDNTPIGKIRALTWEAAFTLPGTLIPGSRMIGVDSKRKTDKSGLIAAAAQPAAERLTLHQIGSVDPALGKPRI
jgi:hypothetical protein